MKTIVAFTNSKVQIICGEGSTTGVTISKVIDVSFDMNCVLSGVVTDTDVFIAGMKLAWETNGLPQKGVILSLDGNNIKSKKASIPKVNHNKTLDIAAMEFKEIEVFTNPVFGYVTLGEPPTGREIIAIGAEYEFVQTLVELFAGIGITIACVTSTRCAMIKLMGLLDFVKGKSCMIQTMDEETLTTILVEQGNFVNISTSRVFSEHGTAAFGAEIARSISQLMQFQTSARSESLATEVHMAGFSDADFAVAKEQIEPLSMSVFPFAESGNMNTTQGMNGRLFLHGGALALSATEGNLFAAYKSKQANTQKRDKLLLKILPILLLVGILTVCSSVLIVGNMAREKTISALTAYVKDPANIEAAAEYDAMVAESTALSARIRASDDIKAAIESYPLATSKLNGIIAASGSGIVEINITSYTANSGVFTFTALGQNPEKINQFVKALTDTGIFIGVTYNGYASTTVGTATGVTSNQATTSGYIVNVSCVLSPQAGKEGVA